MNFHYQLSNSIVCRNMLTQGIKYFIFYLKNCFIKNICKITIKYYFIYWITILNKIMCSRKKRKNNFIKNS